MNTTFLKRHEILVGSKWKRVDGYDQTVTILEHDKYNWNEVNYCWKNGSHSLDYLSFQCRYCPV